MSWIADDRTRKQIGPFTTFSERRRGRAETVHHVDLPDGRIVRVYPDDQTTGQRRSQTILKALREVADAAWPGIDPATYLVGALTLAGIPNWRITDDEADGFDSWLGDWLPEDTVTELVKALNAEGWKITREEA